MALFKRKTETPEAPAAESKADDLRAQMEPWNIAIRSLERDLEAARAEEARLREQYEETDGVQELWEIRQRQNGLATRIGRLERKLQEARDILAPLKAEHHALKCAEQVAKNNADAEAY